jgi:SAM-dependent methyltransferase
MGHDPGSIIAAVGLDEAMLNDPDARVHMSVGVGFLARAVEQTGDVNLGLHLAQHVAPTQFDVHFYAMLSSATLGDAYERLSRYQRLVHETSRVELAVNDDKAFLRHQLPGGLPIDVDPDQIRLAIQASKGRPGATFTTADATHLPFESNRFNVVASNKTTHHIPDWQVVLREMDRVLKPNGIFIFSDLTLPPWVAGLVRPILGRAAGVFCAADLASAFEALRLDAVSKSVGRLHYEAFFVKRHHGVLT